MMKQVRGSSDKSGKRYTLGPGNPMAAKSFFSAWRGYMIAMLRLAAMSRRDVG
jgi:hypothetical protein